MDAIYLVRYWVTSVVEGRVPYLSDIESALWVLRDHSVLQIYTFGFVMLLQISIIASCFLFLLSSQKVRWLVYLQTPLRLVFFHPFSFSSAYRRSVSPRLQRGGDGGASRRVRGHEGLERLAMGQEI